MPSLETNLFDTNDDSKNCKSRHDTGGIVCSCFTVLTCSQHDAQDGILRVMNPRADHRMPAQPWLLFQSLAQRRRRHIPDSTELRKRFQTNQTGHLRACGSTEDIDRQSERPLPISSNFGSLLCLHVPLPLHCSQTVQRPPLIIRITWPQG